MNKQEKILIAAISILSVIIIGSVGFLLINGEKTTDKNSVSVYFIKNSGDTEFKITPVKRKLSDEKTKISIAVEELLKGPTEKEKKQGFFTEIPSETKLLGIKETEEKIKINISEDFESGGGSTSMDIRLKQLIKTVNSAEKVKPVYLELDGKEVSAIGGEGIIVPQPLSGNLSKDAN